MPFIRLSDSYIDHPKFLVLSDGAFRLWHEGMAFCRKHETDGRINGAALQGFRYARPSRITELEQATLWHKTQTGYDVHDYLDWNHSKDEAKQQREASVERTRKWRSRRSGDASQHAHVLDKDRIGSGSSEKKGVAEKPHTILAAPPSTELAHRAAKLLETFGELYSKLRHGARFLRLGNSLQWTEACTLCDTWDDDTLVKLIEILLTTDDEWVAKTDRGWKIFVARAQWCAERLATWEASRRVTA